MSSVPSCFALALAALRLARPFYDVRNVRRFRHSYSKPKMVVGTLEICLRMDGCFNLKEKRRILRSLMDRTRRDYHVSIAETDDLDLWNVATLGVACVSNEVPHAQSILTRVVELFDLCPDVEVESAEREVMRR